MIADLSEISKQKSMLSFVYNQNMHTPLPSGPVILLAYTSYIDFLDSCFARFQLLRSLADGLINFFSSL